MKVLITGRGGQLGRHLNKSIPEGVQVKSTNSSELDITDGNAVRAMVDQFRPDLLINSVAYTAVDRAEEEKERAYSVNSNGVVNLAEAARIVGARMIHISTDFVFDGSKSSPYRTDDMPSPINVYGASKLEGEQKVLETLGSNAAVIRTSWLYSGFGNNFVLTMLRLMAERDELGVVCDQVGSPTWAGSLSKVVWCAACQKSDSVFHWSDAGVASWYDFAVAIYEEATAYGLLETDVVIRPIMTDAYPTPAKRPSYSVLDKSKSEKIFNCPMDHWRINLRLMLHELKEMRDE